MKKIQSLDLIAGGIMHYGIAILISPNLSDDEVNYLSDMIANYTSDSKKSAFDNILSLRDEAQRDNIAFISSYEVTVN